MSERKVIDLFTRKAVEVDKTTGEPLSLPELPDELDNGLDLTVAASLLEMLTMFKQNGSLRQKNIDARRVLVRASSNEDLYTWMNRGTERDWRLRPSFYAAVYEELFDRGLTGKTSRS